MSKESYKSLQWGTGDIGVSILLLAAFYACSAFDVANVASYWQVRGFAFMADFFALKSNVIIEPTAFPHAEAILATALVLLSLSILGERPWYITIVSVFIAPVLAIAIALFCYSAFSLVVNPFVCAGMAALTLAIITTRRFVHRIQNGHRLKNILGDAVAVNVMSTLSHSPKKVALEGASHKLTFLSCGLRGTQELFDALREKPEALLTAVRMVMEPLIDEILASGGTVEERSNTHIKAFWNAPLPLDNHEQIACDCATEMVKRLDTVNNQLEILSDQIGCNIPQLSVGIGITTGYGTIGNYGTDDRPHYSAIGESSTLAEELQKASRVYGPAIVVGEHTRNAVQNNFAFIEVDRISINSENPPTSVYVIAGSPVIKARPEFQDMVDQHARLFRAYRSRNWPQARIELQKCKESEGIHDRLYQLYEERLDFYQENSPEIGWDGAFKPHASLGISYK